MTLSLPWLRFIDHTLFSHYILFSVMLHNRHRRDYDEQQAVAVVKHHHQGCQFNAKRASTKMYLSG